MRKVWAYTGEDNYDKKTIIFEVRFEHEKNIWKKIELKSNNSLEDLHNAIQFAINWDNDHMYAFFMDNIHYSKNKEMEYTCPVEPEGRKTTDKAKLNSFNFIKGQKFAYVFDFGEDHHFEIKVVEFEIFDNQKKYPFLVDSKGKFPKQY